MKSMSYLRAELSKLILLQDDFRVWRWRLKMVEEWLPVAAVRRLHLPWYGPGARCTGRLEQNRSSEKTRYPWT